MNKDIFLKYLELVVIIISFACFLYWQYNFALINFGFFLFILAADLFISFIIYNYIKKNILAHKS